MLQVDGFATVSLVKIPLDARFDDVWMERNAGDREWFAKEYKLEEPNYSVLVTVPIIPDVSSRTPRALPGTLTPRTLNRTQCERSGCWESIR